MTLFQDQSTILNIKSTWEREKLPQVSSLTQSDPIFVQQVAIQSTDYSDAHVHLLNQIQTEKEAIISKEDKLTEIDYSSLEKFLNSVEQLTSSQLIENANSTAFQGKNN
jgi:inactivated superfamily I helicase